ncbi:MAG: type I phosphomannose isomerase catalytic subunit [Acidimicrobiia bacterium]|nr:type I phosphomannose isomerase catalytic subunit [Acidimicrobiia bacterium]
MLPDLIRFRPLLVERPWGGRRLSDLGRELPDGAVIGESWELADLPAQDGAEERCTVVEAGALEGLRPVDLIERYGPRFIGSAAPGPDGRLPLLVKTLDARENLSVQVHPPEAIADLDQSFRAKTESWYVLAATDDAKLWLDVRADVDTATVSRHMSTSAIVDLLGEVPASVGDFHHIPAGRVHALGAGTMVFEIQTPSDTTFRIYDWDDHYDRPPRELHPEQAMASIVRGDPAAFSVAAMGRHGRRTLVRTESYWLVEHRTDEGVISLDPRPELRVVMVVRGTIRTGDEEISAGQVVVLPASSSHIGDLEADAQSVVLEAGLV